MRSDRLRRRSEYDRVYEQGQRVHGQFMTVFRVSSAPSPDTRFGVSASRKLGKAVDRNRAKRVAREIFRLNRPPGGMDIVIVPRRQMLKAPFPLLEAEFRRSLTRNGSAPQPKPRSPRRPGAAQDL